MLTFTNVPRNLEHYWNNGTLQSRVVPLLWELVSGVMELPLHVMECVLCAVFWCGASCSSWRNADPRTGFKGNGIPLQSRAWHSHAGYARTMRAWKQKSPLSRAIKNPPFGGFSWVDYVMPCWLRLCPSRPVALEASRHHWRWKRKLPASGIF